MNRVKAALSKAKELLGEAAKDLPDFVVQVGPGEELAEAGSLADSIRQVAEINVAGRSIRVDDWFVLNAPPEELAIVMVHLFQYFIYPRKDGASISAGAFGLISQQEQMYRRHFEYVRRSTDKKPGQSCVVFDRAWRDLLWNDLHARHGRGEQ